MLVFESVVNWVAHGVSSDNKIEWVVEKVVNWRGCWVSCKLTELFGG